jgi:hypothetical protein
MNSKFVTLNHNILNDTLASMKKIVFLLNMNLSFIHVSNGKL